MLFYYILFYSESLSNAVSSFLKISMPIIDGLILAYLMTPVMNTIERRLVRPLYEKSKVPATKKSEKRIRAFSILITLVVIFVVAYEFFSLIIPELIRSIQSIIFQFPMYVSNLASWAAGLLENNPELEGIFNDLFNKIFGFCFTFHIICPSILDIVAISALFPRIKGYPVFTPEPAYA